MRRTRVLCSRLAAMAGMALGVAAAGCAPAGHTPRPATTSADFVRASAEPGDQRQRLYIGHAGNGVFLGPAGDGAPRRTQASRTQSPIAFGDLWDDRSRKTLISLTFAPGPSASDAYWQVLDINTGQATTYWEVGSFPARRRTCRVESVVTPDGVICWQVRSPGRPVQMSLEAPSLDPKGWEIREGVATHRLKSASGWATVSVNVVPTPEWRLVQTGGGEGRRNLLEADLGQEAFIALVQRTLPEGAGDEQSSPKSYASFEEARQASAGAWSEYWARSAVNIPDEEVLKWYRRSLYYLGAMAGNSRIPPGPMGPYPDRWGGRIFGHDTTYMHAALLSSNHATESDRFVEWYLASLDSARRIARETYHLPGARYGWEQNWRGEECAPQPFRDEHHVNADIAWQAWRQAEWTGDGELAARIEPLLRETGEFLAAHLQWDTSMGAFVSPRSCDLDEDAGEVVGAIATQASAAWLAEVCHERGISTEAIERIRGRVHLPQAPSVDGPVLTGYVGDTAPRPMKHPSPILPIWWLASIDADTDLARRTFASALGRVDLNRTPTFNRPWLAAAAAQLHDGDSAASLLGDLVEGSAVIDDTCFTETQGSTWTHFLTTCGALVAAVDEMLLQCPEQGVIQVFPAIPAEWKRQGASFETLLARGGFLVSAKISTGKVVVTLNGRLPADGIVLDLPAVAEDVHGIVVEVDGVRVSPQEGGPQRIRIHLPASPKALRRVQATARAD